MSGTTELDHQLMRHFGAKVNYASTKFDPDNRICELGTNRIDDTKP